MINHKICGLTKSVCEFNDCEMCDKTTKYYMKWALCTLKNLAVPNLKMHETSDNPFILLVDILPNDTIRINNRRLSKYSEIYDIEPTGWCNKYCEECMNAI